MASREGNVHPNSFNHSVLLAWDSSLKLATAFADVQESSLTEAAATSTPGPNLHMRQDLPAPANSLKWNVEFVSAVRRYCSRKWLLLATEITDHDAPD